MQNNHNNQINTILKVVSILVLVAISWDLLQDFSLGQLLHVTILFAIILPRKTVVPFINKIWNNLAARHEAKEYVNHSNK